MGEDFGMVLRRRLGAPGGTRTQSSERVTQHTNRLLASAILNEAKPHFGGSEKMEIVS